MQWHWQGIHLKGRRVRTAPDFVVYDRLEVRAFDERESEILLDLHFSGKLGRYYVRKLTLEAFDELDEVSGARLREIPLHALSRESLEQGGVVELDSGEIFSPSDLAARAAEITKDGPSGDGAMLATARAYRYAQILQRSPAKAVQEALSLTAPTATLWIRRARTLGLLGDFGDSDG